MKVDHHQTSRLTIYLDTSRILGDVCKGFLAAEQSRPEIIHMQFSHLVKTAQWPGVMLEGMCMQTSAMAGLGWCMQASWRVIAQEF